MSAATLDTVEVHDTDGELDGYVGTCTCGTRTNVRCCRTCASHDIADHGSSAHGTRTRWAAP